MYELKSVLTWMRQMCKSSYLFLPDAVGVDFLAVTQNWRGRLAITSLQIKGDLIHFERKQQNQSVFKCSSKETEIDFLSVQ